MNFDPPGPKFMGDQNFHDRSIKLGQKLNDYYWRHMFLVVSVSMLNKLRLGVLGVAKITNECVYVHAVCVVWRTCPYECV